MQSNPRVPFRLSTEREKIAPPNGKSLIVHVVVNIEHWQFDEPMPRHILTPPQGRSQVPDIPNFSWAEYGNRCGMPRLIKVLADRRLPATASINAGVIEVYPSLATAILDAGWEFMGHGLHQRSLGAEVSEATQIEKALGIIDDFTGRRPRGWLGPGLAETMDTPDLLKAAGIDYLCEWVIDDLPCWMTTRHGPMIAMPYNLELNDSVIYAVEKHSSDEMMRRTRETVRTFEREIGETGEPRVLTLPLHPHLSGVPHRIGFVAQVLDDLLDRDDTVFMNGSDIADWFLAEDAKAKKGV